MRAWLAVELDGTRLEARLERAGAPVVRGERHVELTRIRELEADIARVLNRGSRWADRDQGSRALLARKGQALFDALLPGPVKASLREAAGGDLCVAVSGELSSVPWELLHSGHGFLGLLFALGRMSDRGVARPPRTGDERWRVLVVADPRGDLIGSYYEGLTLRDELAGGDDLEVDLRSSEVGVDEVRELLRGYDVVHYAGHAEPVGGPGTAGERGWWLRDGVLGPSAIRELAGGLAFPRLVFANACRSARVEVDGGAGTGTSLAEAFVEAGAEHCVGTVWDVPDEPASGFALAFYAALRAGCALGEAVRRARVGLAERYGEDSVYWAAWVLHGDPAGACFGNGVPGDLGARGPLIATGGGAVIELRAAAARVRGATADGAASRPAIVSLDAPRGVWTRLATGVTALAAIVALAWSVGHDGAMIVARPPRTADLGPVERLPPMPVALPALVGATPVVTPSATEASIGIIGEVDGAGVETMRLASGESFRIRWQVPRAGYASIWQVESQGDVRPVMPGALVDGGPARELPGGGRWFFLDEKPGSEHFFLAWRAHAPDDDVAFAAEIAAELAALAPRGASSEKLELRGLGGIRRGPAAMTSAAIAERFREVLEDRFDVVQAVEVEHR